MDRSLADRVVVLSLDDVAELHADVPEHVLYEGEPLFHFGHDLQCLADILLAQFCVPPISFRRTDAFNALYSDWF